MPRNQLVSRASAADQEPLHGSRAEAFHTIWTVRGVLLLQLTIFLALASLHFDLLISSYRQRDAGATELVIAALLVAGLLLTWTPRWSRRAATAAQSFGTLGVLVGLFALALGIGPRTVLDLTLNAVLLLTLIAGLAMTTRQGLGVSQDVVDDAPVIDRPHRATAHADTQYIPRSM